MRRIEGRICFHCDLVVHLGTLCWGEKSVLVLELVAVRWVRRRFCYKRAIEIFFSLIHDRSGVTYVH